MAGLLLQCRRLESQQWFCKRIIPFGFWIQVTRRWTSQPGRSADLVRETMRKPSLEAKLKLTWSALFCELAGVCWNARRRDGVATTHSTCHPWNWLLDFFLGEDRELTECSGLVFRFKSDLDLVSYKKTLMPLCAFLRMLTVDHGLANCDVEAHLVSPKYHPSTEACFCFL